MEDELVQLADIYREPGFLFLAESPEGERLGCVGLRSLPGHDATAEMRRLFVRPQTRGTGLGRRLVQETIAAARQVGISQIVLNTVPAMSEAITLYEQLGFAHIEPYVDSPDDGVRYYGLDLG